jgi:hypothetical protein
VFLIEIHKRVSENLTVALVALFWLQNVCFVAAVSPHYSAHVMPCSVSLPKERGKVHLLLHIISS